MILETSDHAPIQYPYTGEDYAIDFKEKLDTESNIMGLVRHEETSTVALSLVLDPHYVHTEADDRATLKSEKAWDSLGGK